MKAFDFEYDGIKLSDRGFVICNFGSKGLNTVSNGSKITFNTVSVSGGSKHYLTSAEYEDCLESTIQICKNSCLGDIMEISSTELREMTRWLNRKKFLKFKILSEDYIDLYFEASFNTSKIELDGKLVGLELEVLTNRPFALKEQKTIVIDANDDIRFSYVWGKYKVIRNYEITKTEKGTTEPDDCLATTYSSYEITGDGQFELSNSSAGNLTGYHYISNTIGNRKSIYYEYMKTSSYGSISFAYQLWTLGDTYTEETKGDFVEYITSDNINAYPKDGIQDDEQGVYWYTYVRTDTVQYKKVSINNISHEEGYIYPYTEITITENGDLNIHNDLENRSTHIANCVAGEVITMDYPIIKSSVQSHNIQNDFNWNFFRIANTFENSRNNLTISLPCTIKITYSPIVKVGL